MRPEASIRPARFVAVTAMLAAVSACDPCAPTFGCEVAPHATLVGQLVDPNSGLPVANASIELRRITGVDLRQSSATTPSDSDGNFEFSLPANEIGDLTVDVSIQAPGRPRFVVADVRMRTSDRAGDATVLNPWVGFYPQFPVVIAVRDTVGVAIRGAVVVFRRTGGRVLLAGETPVDSVRGTTGSDGFLQLMNGITTDSTGIVIGDFLIRLQSGSVQTIRGHTVTALPEFRRPPGFIVLPVVR